MEIDYSFFEKSINKLRVLSCGGPDVTCLIDAPVRLFGNDLGVAPKILSEVGWERTILTRSYARKPGKGLEKLEQTLKAVPPCDFQNFHVLYEEALVTTRTFPIHLWSEKKILEEIENWRDLYPFPLRFFRFGQYWDRYGLWFGLWNVLPGGPDWKVIITSHDNRDDDLDSGRSKEYILGSSFHEWLKGLIERDGLPDPYMDLGLDGGFLDPI